MTGHTVPKLPAALCVTRGVRWPQVLQGGSPALRNRHDVISLPRVVPCAFSADPAGLRCARHPLRQQLVSVPAVHRIRGGTPPTAVPVAAASPSLRGGAADETGPTPHALDRTVRMIPRATISPPVCSTRQSKHPRTKYHRVSTRSKRHSTAADSRGGCPQPANSAHDLRACSTSFQSLPTELPLLVFFTIPTRAAPRSALKLRCPSP